VAGQTHTGFGGGGKPEIKRTLGRPRSGWKDNIKKIFREYKDDVNWIDLTEVVDSCVKKIINHPAT